MYLTQLTTLLLLVASQTSMSKRVDDVSTTLDMEQFDCVSTGEKWREFKTDALKHLSGKCDDSGSSLADHMLQIDMGGAGAAAPAPKVNGVLAGAAPPPNGVAAGAPNEGIGAAAGVAPNCLCSRWAGDSCIEF